MNRRLFLLGGSLTLAIAWAGPIAYWARSSFAGHMVMHVLVIAVAAPLIAIGLAGGALDVMRKLRAPRIQAAFAVLASAVEFVVVWAWHTPGLHHLAAESVVYKSLEQGSYLAVGVAVWLPAFGGDRASRKTAAPAGMAALLLTSMHMALLGVLIAQAERPLYRHLSEASAQLAPLQDQQLGGVIMLIFGGTTYLAGALYLLNRLLKNESPATTPELVHSGD